MLRPFCYVSASSGEASELGVGILQLTCTHAVLKSLLPLAQHSAPHTPGKNEEISRNERDGSYPNNWMEMAVSLTTQKFCSKCSHAHCTHTLNDRTALFTVTLLASQNTRGGQALHVPHFHTRTLVN